MMILTSAAATSGVTIIGALKLMWIVCGASPVGGALRKASRRRAAASLSDIGFSPDPTPRVRRLFDQAQDSRGDAAIWLTSCQIVLVQPSDGLGPYFRG